MTTLVKHQKKTFGPKVYRDEHGDQMRIKATVRHDDECGNGHNTFSITADIDQYRGGRWNEYSGGCCHDEVAQHFPELAPLIKWHLCSTDGPMHYIANTMYHASDRDYRGLLAGEKRQLRNGKTGLGVWEYVVRDASGDRVKVGGSGSNWVNAESKPTTEGWSGDYEPVWITGEGKPRDLDAARRCAIWPDATDEELTAPGLEDRLKARLPALLAEFRAAVESLGLEY